MLERLKGRISACHVVTSQVLLLPTSKQVRMHQAVFRLVASRSTRGHRVPNMSGSGDAFHLAAFSPFSHPHRSTKAFSAISIAPPFFCFFLALSSRALHPPSTSALASISSRAELSVYHSRIRSRHCRGATHSRCRSCRSCLKNSQYSLI